jgi:hypothetical protein
MKNKENKRKYPKYLTTRMTILGEKEKVWTFRNPWDKPHYKMREFLLMNKIVLPLICTVLSFLSRKNDYYQMRLRCKQIGAWKKP